MNHVSITPPGFASFAHQLATRLLQDLELGAHIQPDVVADQPGRSRSPRSKAWGLSETFCSWSIARTRKATISCT